ncbi:MAG: CYTH domain-containing protein [Candidatus Woesearchaeota archaeon]
MTSNNIEVEVRSFLTDDQYDRLLGFFRTSSSDVVEDDQITYYFEAPIDIRIQQNNSGSKIWMKKGKMHDNAREELEVNFGRDEFPMLEQMFAMMGYPVKVKWHRKRHKFRWKGFDVCIDDNKGYGKIIEIERKTTAQGKDWALLEIRDAFNKIDILVTPKEEFDRKYMDYVQNWRELTR